MPKQALFDAAKSVKSYLTFYLNHLRRCLDGINENDLNAFKREIEDVRLRNNRIFVAGNGGSSSIAEHLSCDFMKGMTIDNNFAVQVISLPSNTPVITALGNDVGYDYIFSSQLEYYGLEKDDVVILISSSGKSPNIVRAAQVAKERGAKLIGLTGFDGGQLRLMADLSLHIPIENYGIAEDAHQILMHVIAQVLLKDQM